MAIDRGAIKGVLMRFLVEDPRIAAVYIFGSFIHGLFTDESDLELGILFRPPNIPSQTELFELRALLSDKCRISVDLVCLNKASPILAMQVLKKGEKLLDIDPHSTHEYYIYTVNSYDDLKRVRKPIEEQILNGRIFQ